MSPILAAKGIADTTMLDIVRRCSDAECNYPMNAGWHGGRPGYGYDPLHAKAHATYQSDIARFDFPGVPEKIVLAKLRGLSRRRLIDGCGCGCRGDWEITEQGRAFLAATA